MFAIEPWWNHKQLQKQQVVENHMKEFKLMRTEFRLSFQLCFEVWMQKKWKEKIKNLFQTDSKDPTEPCSSQEEEKIIFFHKKLPPVVRPSWMIASNCAWPVLCFVGFLLFALSCVLLLIWSAIVLGDISLQRHSISKQSQSMLCTQLLVHLQIGETKHMSKIDWLTCGLHFAAGNSCMETSLTLLGCWQPNWCLCNALSCAERDTGRVFCGRVADHMASLAQIPSHGFQRGKLNEKQTGQVHLFSWANSVNHIQSTTFSKPWLLPFQKMLGLKKNHDKKLTSLVNPNNEIYGACRHRPRFHRCAKQTTPSTDESINDERASPTHEVTTDFARCNVCLVDV